MLDARIARAIFTLVLCLLVTACASQPALVTGNPNLTVTTNGLPAPSLVKSYEGGREYRIGSMDLLTISVFGVNELTQEVRVDSLGNIDMPLIGAVRAGGRTTVELQRDIATKLSNGYLQSPQVSVFIKEFASQRITVEGEVRKPGVVPLTGPSSLLQVIAGAEGLSDYADHRGIVVFRMVDGKKMAAVFDIDAIGRGAVDDPQVFGDDIVVVATSGSKDRLRTLIRSVPVLGMFRLLTL